MNANLSRARFVMAITLTFVAGALLAAWLAAGGNRGGHATTAADNQVDERLASLEARVERIDRGLDRIATLMSAPGSSRAPAAAPAANGGDDEEAIGRLQDSGRPEHQMRMYAARFRSESRDPNWGPSTEAELTRAMLSEELIANVEQAPSAYRIQCRTSLCEMSFDFADAGLGQGWMSTFTTMTGSKLKRVWYTTLPQPDGSVRLQMYGVK